MWEEIVVSLRPKPVEQQTGQATDTGDEGLDYFERAMQLLTLPDSQAKRRVAEHCPVSLELCTKYQLFENLEPVRRNTHNTRQHICSHTACPHQFTLSGTGRGARLAEAMERHKAQHGGSLSSSL
jgi:hypothetical protein